MLKEDGYIVMRKLIPEQTCGRIRERIEDLQRKELLRYSDGQVDKAYTAYGMPVTERLLQLLCPIVTTLIDAPLYPSYSYLRVYLNGAELPKHVDRESCEISMTMTIDVKGAATWPIYFDLDGKTQRVDLGVGDAVIYEGMRLAHWREPFHGERQVQGFLHFVRQDGPFSSFKFDRRAGLGVP